MRKVGFLEQPLLDEEERETSNPLLTSFNEETPTKKKGIELISDEKATDYSPEIIDEESPDLSKARAKSSKKSSKSSKKLSNFDELGVRKEISEMVMPNRQDLELFANAPVFRIENIHNDDFQWNYDPFKTPPDLELLEKHYKAKQVGHFDIYNPKTFMSTCPCCHLPLGKEPLQLNCPRRKLAILGTGFPLYFEMLFYGCLILVVLFLISGLYCTLVIYGLCGDKIKGDGFSKNDDCYGYLGIVYSSKVPEQSMSSQRWLNFGSVLILIGMISLLKVHLRDLCEETSESFVKPSDFTLLMKNIPPQTTEEEVRQFLIKNALPNLEIKDFDIEKINFAYKIGDYIVLIRMKNSLLIKKEILLKKKNKYERKCKERSSTYSKISLKINQINRDIRAIDKDLKNFEIECENGMNDRVSSRAFVTFKSQRMCKKIIKFWLISPLKRLWMDVSSTLNCYGIKENLPHHLKGSQIMIERSPEPLDIIWENLGVSNSAKMVRRVFTYTMSSFLSGIAFFIILLISKTQEEFKQGNHDYFLEIALSLLCSIILSIFNGLLKVIIEFLSKYERYTCYTKYETSKAFKLAVMQFINMALIPFFLFLMYKDIFTQKILLQNIFFVFAGNIVFEPIALLLDPRFYWKVYKRSMIRRNVAVCTLTQGEAKKHFEGPVPEMSHKYATMTKNMLSAAFLAPIFPFGLILCVLAMTVTYWLDKYLLLRRYGFPANLSEDLAFTIIAVIEFLPVLYSSGNLVYDIVMLDNSFMNLPNLMSLVFSVVFVIFCEANIEISARLKIKTQKKIYNRMSTGAIDENEDSLGYDFPFGKNGSEKEIPKEKLKKTQVSYKRARTYFFTDYDRLNPITALESTKEWLKHIENLNLQPELKTVLKSTAFMEAGQINKKKAQANPLYESIKNYALFGHSLDAQVDEISQMGRQNIEVPMNKAINLRNSLRSKNAFNYLIALQSTNISLIKSQLPDKLRSHIDRRKFQSSRDQSNDFK